MSDPIAPRPPRSPAGGLIVERLGRADLDGAAELLERAWPDRGAAIVCAEKLFEPGSAEPVALGVRAAEQLAGLAVVAGRYLRVLAVAPEHRRRRIGTALVDDAAARAGAPLIAAAEPGNYLTPGVDAADLETIAFLEARGFAVCGEAIDLEIDVAGNPRVSSERRDAAIARAAEAGYRVARAGDRDRRALVEAVGAEHGAAWAVEIDRALGPPSGVFVARRDGAVVGFAARDGNNRGLGGFGPAAVSADHRGRGLGEALLLACLVDVAAAGHRRCRVSWIGPRAFYERVAGVAAERRFVHMRRG